MPKVKMFVISMNASKTFLVKHLLNDYNHGKVEFFKGEQLEQIQDKFYKLNSPNIRNVVVFFKHRPNGAYIDSILELKSKSRYDYIQEYYLLGQVFGQKVFIFQMSINGVGSGMNFVTRMQFARDLQNAWIMFDHVKHVVGQTTMVCHVYNSTYCKMMTIVICDMQYEDMEVQ